MKIVFLVFGILASCHSYSQGIQFFEGTFEEALELANREDKVVFVDAYTSWCGPCKRMSKHVFTEGSVGEYYNKNFVNMKINMEMPDGRKFGTSYPVGAYPTFYYIKPDGEVLHTTRGGRNPAQFIDLGKEALSKYDRTSEYKKKYEDGDRSFETVMAYIKGLNKTDDSSGLKVVNEYLMAQEDLSSRENLLVIFEGMTEVDSKVYDYFNTYKRAIIEEVGEDRYLEKVREAADRTVEKAVKYETKNLLEEAQDKRSAHLPSEAKEYNIQSEMKYSAATNDAKSYLKCAKKYAKKYAKDAVGKNALVVSTIESFDKNKDVLEWAEGLAKDATQQGGLSDYYVSLAYVQYYLGKKEEARLTAEKALQLAGEQNADPTAARSLLMKMKA